MSIDVAEPSEEISPEDIPFIEFERSRQDMVPRPPSKYVGGKGQMVDLLGQLAPEAFEVYFEPFSGYAAFLFHLLREERITDAWVSDINDQIAIVFNTLRDNAQTVLHHFKSPIFANSAENFYTIRGWDRTPEWSRWKKDPRNWSLVTTRALYLGALSYNGLWRENALGQHNASYCKNPDKVPYDEENLLAVSRELSFNRHNIRIGEGSYRYLWEWLEQEEDLFAGPNLTNGGVFPGDFVYFDPPYLRSYTDYSAKGWDMHDFKNLKELFDALTTRGVYAMMSMSDTLEAREFFRRYNLASVTTACRMNRTQMAELIIRNYGSSGDVGSSPVQASLERYLLSP